MHDGVIEIEIPSHYDLVAVVRMVVAAAASTGAGFTGDRLDDLRVVTSEAVTNAIEANQSNGGGTVTLRCEVQPGSVRLQVSDHGPGIRPRAELPDMEDPSRLDIEGGFGIPLMQRLSSTSRFRSTPSGTIVDLEMLGEV